MSLQEKDDNKISPDRKDTTSVHDHFPRVSSGREAIFEDVVTQKKLFEPFWLNSGSSGEKVFWYSKIHGSLFPLLDGDFCLTNSSI